MDIIRFDGLSEKNFNRAKKHYIRAGYRMAEFGYRSAHGWYIVLIKRCNEVDNER